MSKDGSEKTEPAKRQRQTGVVVGTQMLIKIYRQAKQIKNWTSKANMTILHTVMDSDPSYPLYIYHTVYCVRNEERLSGQMTGSGDVGHLIAVASGHVRIGGLGMTTEVGGVFTTRRSIR